MSFRPPISWLLPAALAAVVGVLGFAGSAWGWTAQSDGITLTVADEVGADDALAVADDPGAPDRVIVSDAGSEFAGAVPGGCVLSPEEVLSCPAALVVAVVAGVGSDEVVLSSTRTTQSAVGGMGDDALTGSPLADALVGGEGDDVVDGRGGPDVLAGDAGEDEITGGVGTDQLDAGPDNDTVGGGDEIDEIQGGGGNDELSGGDGADTIGDTEGSDTIDGQAGDDTIDAGPGDDEISGGAGLNALTGGQGDDTIALTGAAGEHATGDDGVDELLASDSSGPVQLDGGPGRDFVDGSPSADELSGSEGADAVAGNGGDDMITGGDGDDTIDPGAGTNNTHGDAGTDTITLDGDPADTAHGDEGDDVLTAAVGGSVVHGGPGRDQLDGDDGLDQLHGGPDADTITAHGGADLIDAGDGDDWVDGGPGADDLHGGLGADIQSYEQSEDAVSVTVDDQPGDGTRTERDNAHTDIETLIGSDGDDTLTAGPLPLAVQAGDGDDRLTGGAGADQFDAGPGDDVLDGAGGGDVLAGGDGADTISYATRITPVTVLLGDAGPVSGEAGEGDQLVGVENTVGGATDDTINGQPGVANRIDGAAGEDTIHAYDSDAIVDEIVCGTGRDTAHVDRQDIWEEPACEAVTASGVPQLPRLSFKGRKALGVNKRTGLARLQLFCEETTVRWCAGTVLLRSGGRRAALTRVFRIAQGLHRQLTIRVNQRIRRKLRAGKRPKLRGTIRVEDALGHTATVRFWVTAKPRKSR